MCNFYTKLVLFITLHKNSYMLLKQALHLNIVFTNKVSLTYWVMMLNTLDITNFLENCKVILIHYFEQLV